MPRKWRLFGHFPRGDFHHSENGSATEGRLGGFESRSIPEVPSPQSRRVRVSDIFECACGAVTVGHPCLRCAGPFTMPDTHPSSDVLERTCAALFANLRIEPVPNRMYDWRIEPESVEEAARAVIADRDATIERLSAELERVKRGGEQGVAADALDFACGHCKPEEALAFLEDWRFGRAVEWPGFVKWLARQRTCAAEASALSDTKAG